MLSENNLMDSGTSAMVEGIAWVVAVDGATVWLEPEQTTSCGSCASSSMCGAKGVGSIANRLEARRFALPNPAQLRVGDRVVIGVREDALLKASMTAYALPLATLLGAGAVAQWLAGSDVITMLAMVGGLAVGLLLAWLGAGRLSAHGNLTPTFLRRALAGETCRPE